MVNLKQTQDQINAITKDLKLPEHLDATSVNKLTNLISNINLNLANTLDDHTMYVNQETVNSISSLIESLNWVKTLDLNEITNTITTLLTNPHVPTDVYTKQWDLRNAIANLIHAYSPGWRDLLDTRIWELGTIISYINYFNHNSTLNNITFTWVASNIDTSIMTITGAPRTAPERHIYLRDSEWKELERSPRWSNNYVININWQKITIEAEFIGDNLRINRITPDDIDIDIPLSITAQYEGVSNNLIIASNKTFNITSNRLNRKSIIENYFWNINLTNHEIQNRLNPILNQNFNTNWDLYEIIRNQIESHIPEDSILNNTQKEELIRKLIHQQKPQISNRMRDILTHSITWTNNFYDWFSDTNRERNKWESSPRTPATYKKYIANNLDSCILAYITDSLWTPEIITQDLVLQEQSNILNDYNTSFNDTITSRDHNTIEKLTMKVLKSSDLKMDNKWWVKKSNYMRFFVGSKKTKNNQIVKINSDTPTNHENTKNVKYDMDLNINNNNEMVLTYKIGNQTNRISWSDPRTLAINVLKDSRIEKGRVRTHMIYNIYKSMIELAIAKWINLSYSKWSTKHEALKHWEDIIIQTSKYNKWTWTCNTQTIFNEAGFLWINNPNDRERNDSLIKWIEELWKFFNESMNQNNRDFYKSTTKRGIIFKSHTATHLPTSWLHPFKKLKSKLSWSTLDFDFDTTVNSWGKNYNISYKKWIFSIKHPDIEKPFESKDLWSILNSTYMRQKCFEWSERDIIWATYKKLIESLRKNKQIQKSAFWVKDPKWWGYYTLNNNWVFSYLPNHGWTSRFFWTCGIINNTSLLRKANQNLPISEDNLYKDVYVMSKFISAMNSRLWIKWSIMRIFGLT